MRAWVCLGLVGLLSSCRKDAASDAAPAPSPPLESVRGIGPMKAPSVPVLAKAAPTELRIRVQNQGTEVLEDVKVTFRGQEESFGNLQPGASSAYRKVTSSFRYGLSEATVGGKRAKLEPLDFFHEKLLPPGDYTWGLAPEGTEHLQLVLTHE